MKRTITICLLLGMLFSLVACKGTQEPVPSSEQASSSMEEKNVLETDERIDSETAASESHPSQTEQNNSTKEDIDQKKEAVIPAESEIDSTGTGNREEQHDDGNAEAEIAPNGSETKPNNELQNNSNDTEQEDNRMSMRVQVGDVVFTATLEDNEAVQELKNRMQQEPVVIQMSDYSGFEKVGPLGKSLPANDSQTTTHAGDIVLYNGNQIVIFYGSNSWSYTRLGHIDDLTGWADALGSGDVTVTFSLE